NEYPYLSELLQNVYSTQEIIESIDKVFDRRGEIKDDASPTLFTIRQQLKSVKTKINLNFDKEIRRLTKENVLGDTKEAFVNDRRVLTVLSNHKRQISGNVLGSSKTGSLTFVEPQVNIELNREFDMLQDDERKEIVIILKALTQKIAVHTELIKAYQETLVQFDFQHAKMKLALEIKANRPQLNKDNELELIEAFHPILWRSNTSNGKKTFSQHIQMNTFSRMLVISGPNAGGKSITLKTIGLLQLMVQSGLLVPVHPNSKMFVFKQILSDIGDNQSIENELSTYSYRLKRMRHFLETTNKRTLLLLDEFGTGSDPDLGGALAEVFFEELYNKKGFGVITTHYANIKLKADQLRNAVNGCMLFDVDTLAPLFRFITGQPGSSFTFEVAQINGIPAEIIEKAKSRIQNEKLEMDSLLSDLQKEKSYLERLNKEHIEAQEIAQKTTLEFQSKKAGYDDKSRSLLQTMELNNRFIHLGQKMAQFIDRFNNKSRKKTVNDDLVGEINKFLKMEKSKIDGIQLQEKIKKAAPKKIKKVDPERDEHQRSKIIIGSQVKLISTKKSGTVELIDGEQITVLFGFMRMKVDRSKLSFIQ
ncbi:MAG: DNA mismatch repair protein MutS, partial [Bacteroidetes bacterium]|nr:DNA mismatch repair protein MutS [Bacteroidota bacterium]